jgi:5-formyltetrahydrofolate cyclo-ligase
MKSGQLKSAKRRIRRAVLAARDRVPPGERSALAELVVERFLALPEVTRARAVMVFWSFGSEVPTAGLIERLHAREALVALPRIERSDLVAVTYAPGDPTRTTSFGAEEPVAGEVLPSTSLDVVAVPGVAFDRTGRRIGYGGGFYDRFLRTVDAFRVAPAFGLQVLDEALPGGGFDLPVDAIVTESETIRDLNSRSIS